MKKLLWAVPLLVAVAGLAPAQNPGPPFSLDTGVSPHFHFNKGGMPIFGPYKGSTLQDLPGGVPRHPKPIPWYAYWPAHAFSQPTGPMPYPYWPTMPPADGGTGQQMQQQPPQDMNAYLQQQPGMMGMPAMQGQGYPQGMLVPQQQPGMLPPSLQGGQPGYQQPPPPMQPAPR